jgi:hypothetical protein
MHTYVLHIKKEIPLEWTPLLSGGNFGNRGCPLKREHTVHNWRNQEKRACDS